MGEKRGIRPFQVLKGLRRENIYGFGYPKIELNVRRREKGMKGGNKKKNREISEQLRRKKFQRNLIKTSKYNIISFIPKNLSEQFRRMTNVYFLVIAILSLIPQISPMTPITSILPLVFVLSVTAIREGYEDYRRHVADREVNHTTYDVLMQDSDSDSDSDGFFIQTKKAQHLLVGDMVIIRKDCSFPADCLLLSTSLSSNTCYVETSQIDGETNLKIQRSVFERLSSSSSISTDVLNASESNSPDHDWCGVHMWKAIVQCSLPTHEIHRFEGNISFLEATHSDGERDPDPDPEFDDCLEEVGSKIPLDISMLLLRGCSLRNTDWVVGMVTYAGNDTKQSLNQKIPPSKFSVLEKRLNKLVIGIFAFKIFLCASLALAAGVFHSNWLSTHWYFGEVLEETQLSTSLFSFFSYFVLLSFLIPMSLMVTLEVVKVMQVFFMENDREMMLPSPEGTSLSRMKAKTSNLNDELGLVGYLFSDKTGTLTDNDMRFALCCAGTILFEFPIADKQLGRYVRRYLPSLDGTTENLGESILSSTLLQGDANTLDEGNARAVALFLLTLSTCHSAVSEAKDTEESSDAVSQDGDEGCDELSFPQRHTSENWEFKAQSPDEIALCNCAMSNGFTFLSRKMETIELEIMGNLLSAKVIEDLDFTSQRRRMSVILQFKIASPQPNGEGSKRKTHYYLFSKGSDTVMLDRLSKSEKNAKPLSTAREFLLNCSKAGLRVMVVACKKLSKKKALSFAADYGAAKGIVDDTEDSHARERAMADLEDEMERGFELLGCTAVEDKLQENVPETLEYFVSAGIKTWVITGDKRETAVNVGYSSQLLDPSKQLITIAVKSSDDCLEALQSAKTSIEGTSISLVGDSGDSGESIDLDLCQGHECQENGSIGLVIDGTSLAFALAEYPVAFMQLASRAYGVICCQVTPLQKAQIVSLVKKQTGEICLAVGDGANDVSMIQEAHIGIGIFGKEGTQAARASDYSLRRFFHLKRLLTVHGRYSIIRNAALIRSSLYKNMATFLVQVWFGLFNGFSATTIYDDWILTTFNILFTSCPPFFLGLFEKDIREETIDKYPKSFAYTQKGLGFTYSETARWLCFAFFHSIVFYSVTFSLFQGNFFPNGQIGGFSTVGTLATLFAITSVWSKIALETHHWTIPTFVGFFLSILVFSGTLVVSSLFPSLWPKGYFVFEMVVSAPLSWLTIPLVMIVALLPDVIFKFLQRQLRPEARHVLQELERTPSVGVDLPEC